MTDLQVSRPKYCDLSVRDFCFTALFTLIAFNVVGCGGPDLKIDRKPVYGKIVGADGRSGTLTFTPIDTSIGPAAMADFVEGAYQFTEKAGPIPGEYSVSIEFETDESSRSKKRSSRMTKDQVDVGGVSYDEAQMTTALVTVDGPFEIDLDITK